MPSNSPFDDLKNLLSQLPDQDHSSVKILQDDMQALPIGGAGGRIRDLLLWLAGWQGKAKPSLAESHICLLASSYEGGMEAEGIKFYIDFASKGQSFVNQLCKTHGTGLRVLEMAVEIPHKAAASPEPVWTEAEVMAAVAFGMEASASGGDLLGLGELAFGSEPYAIAIICRLLGLESGQFAKEEGLRTAAGKAQQLLNGSSEEGPLELLRLWGGREMAASVGAILAARSRQLPVILDGWAPSVAALLLWKMDPSSIDHCQLGAPLNDAHAHAMGKIGLLPIVNMPHDCAMGVGAGFAINMLNDAVSILSLPLSR
ncbi:nicotinate-nucleotide--dimethylbenzimidazole phosphoribosyltransferase [Temperatibacter marinus]|uniref:Nicotinate-nucleotide--dimethylbenzimidazole phosphoribosyltransferase n=1 Tax=Temperatibacter marinus TaxID=1456591 RepID=A0AA52EGB7_9PROT|nr:nicotinate-nucleotide--dimethylbenzimidazole phosphoribosyltransferase [Temperatibacter marinus]WND02613.1 nicotinate-nucleotide--dimethylbenzimidazole phosphoribosyltransferase [Temperatibacter marinus]